MLCSPQQECGRYLEQLGSSQERDSKRTFIMLTLLLLMLLLISINLLINFYCIVAILPLLNRKKETKVMCLKYIRKTVNL